jgi:pimeloyl-ACP methyl ester carboxylesterase
VAGLVYLDALFSYSYATSRDLSLRAKLTDLQNDLQVMTSRPLNPLGIPQPPDLLAKVLGTISEVQQQLSTLQLQPSSGASPATPSVGDLASFGAFGAWFERVRGYRSPEAELRQQRESSPDGRIGPVRTPAFVPVAIQSGVQSFPDIPVPALALCAIPPDSPAADTKAETALREARAVAFERNVAGARVLRVPGAKHYIFFSHEAEVLNAIGAFLDTLK